MVVVLLIVLGSAEASADCRWGNVRCLDGQECRVDTSGNGNKCFTVDKDKVALAKLKVRWMEECKEAKSRQVMLRADIIASQCRAHVRDMIAEYKQRRTQKFGSAGGISEEPSEDQQLREPNAQELATLKVAIDGAWKREDPYHCFAKKAIECMEPGQTVLEAQCFSDGARECKVPDVQ